MLAATAAQTAGTQGAGDRKVGESVGKGHQSYELMYNLQVRAFWSVDR